MSVPDIATLRQRANTIISRAGSGQMRAMLAGICAAKNTGDPLPSDSTGQQLITECQQIIDQADSDALAIFVREFMEFVENATIGGSSGPPVFEGPNPGAGTEASLYQGQIIVSGTLPMTYTVDSGTLPTGTSLNANTGLISGTATTAGDYNFTIRATNDAGTATQAYSVAIAGRAPSFQYPITGVLPSEALVPTDQIVCSVSNDIIGANNPGGWGGTWSTFLPVGLYQDESIGSDPIVWSTSGTLPTGVTINPATGSFDWVTGDPGQFLQQFTFYVVGTNSYGSFTLKFSVLVGGL